MRKSITRRVMAVFICVSLSVFSPTSGSSQVTGDAGVGIIPEVVSEGLARSIFLDLRDINVVDVIKFLALEGDLNIVTSKNVQGRSTLLLQDVTIRDALDIIVLSNQLAYQIQNNIIYVMTEDEYVSMYGRSYNDQREVMTRTLQYAKPSYVTDALQSIASSVGKIIIDEEVGSVVLIDTKDRLEAMDALLVDLEQGVSTEVVPLQYAVAKDLEPQLQAKLNAKGVGNIFADTRSNQLVVSAYKERMKEILPMIKALDREEKAVLIDMRVLQITLNPKYDVGIDWRHQFQDTSSKLLDSYALRSTLPIDASSGSGPATHITNLALGQLNVHDFTLSINALKQVSETNLLSSPRLMVLHGQEAKINIVDTVPYVVTTTSGTGTNATTSEDIRFIDVGVILSVTPTINDDGFVTMKLAPEISSQTGTLTTASSNAIPLVNKTTVESTIVVRDGVTVVLGGLRSNEETVDSRGIPFLMDLPFFGNLFKSRDEAIKKQEIAIFITPKIVTGEKNITDEPPPIKPSRDAYLLQGWREVSTT